MVRTLREWIDQAEELDSIDRVDAKVDWNEEMGAITYARHRSEKGAPALLFENIKDYPGHRSIWNLFSSSKERVALTLYEDPSLSEVELIDRVRDKFNERIEPTQVDPSEATVYENSVYGDDVDLYDYPAPKMWPKDGGRYLGTLNVCLNRDPETGYINVGTYRQMILSENETGIYTSPGKDLRIHMEKQWKKGEPLEVVTVYGAPPEVHLMGGLSVEKNVSEYEYAGGMGGEPIETVEGELTGIPIPADAEYALEGKLQPNHTQMEGPFGEFSGYYGRPESDTPVFTVDAVHHRDDPILTCSMMADNPGCDLEMLETIARSARIWNDLDKLGVPGIQGVYVHPSASSGRCMINVSIEQQYAGHTSQVASLASQVPGGAYMSKFIVVVDHDIDPSNIDQVLWAMGTRFNPEDDIDILTDTWSTYLDPSQNPPEERPYGSKALIDATMEYRYYDEFAERVAVSEDTYERVADRWNELGFEGDAPEMPAYAEELSKEGGPDVDEREMGM